MSSRESAIHIDDDDDSVVDLTDDRPTKKQKPTTSSKESTDFLIPFHLFDTKMSITSSQSATRHPSAKKFFRTLRETIGFDTPSGSSSKDKKFQWLVACNYCFDINYFLQETLPEILSFKRVVVFYGEAGADNGSDGKEYWEELLKGSGNTVEFVRLIPSDPPRSATNPLDMKIPYGVHHTKMFLVGYDEWQQNYNHGLRGWQSKVRVVVHTANILKQDIEWKSQGLYDQDFPLKSSTSSQPEKQQAETIKLAGKRGWPFEDEDPQPFEDDLVSYLESYRYSTPQSWCTTGRTLSEVSQSQILSDKSMSLLSLIRKYDFSKAYAVLIPSIPGKHSLRGDFGYLKLRKAIQEHVIAHRGNNDSTDASIADSKPSARQASTPIICQFSSMGSLSSKWLSDFITALDVNESVEVQTKNKKPEIQLEQKIKLVWPTVEEIRNSIEGYRGGGSVPATSRNVNKDFLAPLYHRWSKDRVHGNRNTDPLGMSKTVPHIKTFLQFTPCANDRTAPSIDWLCLTSHNLSKAAWGEVQNSTGSTTKVLFIRHWELGVFISPSTLAKNVLCDDGVYKSGSVYLRPYTGSSLGGSPISIDCDDEETEEEGVTTTVPIPYDAINPTKYGNGDMPWTIDGPGKVLPDAFGLMGN